MSILRRILLGGISSSVPFRCTWQTTGGSESITLPLMSSGTYDFSVDWGDGSSSRITAWDDAAKTHTYTSADTYTVDIFGIISGFRFDNAGDKTKIQSIVSWGPLELISNKWFFGCSNLVITATDIPSINTTNFTEGFRGCSSITTIPNMGDWDVSSINVISSMFRDATLFNQDISNWDVSSLILMSSAFEATSFNQDIGSWNVSLVTSLNSTFLNATLFNQDISNWDVSSVELLLSTFRGATSFNQDISGWITSSLTQATWAFKDAISFDQDIGSWDITGLTIAGGMFDGVTLSTANYDALLVGWEAQIEQPDVQFHGGNSKYSAGAPATARAALVSNGWFIADGGPA